MCFILTSFLYSFERSDSHFHLVNFLQNGEHWSETEQRFVASSPYITLPQGQRGKRIEGMLKRMDAANVSVAMVSGMPFVKKWSQNALFRSVYYLDSSSRVVFARDTDYTVALAITDYLESDIPNAQEQRQRLFPFVSGFNATDLGAVDMIVKRIKEFPGMWEGIGEVMSRHDDLTNLTTGERPRADHPSIHRLSHFAGAYHLPVSIHHNIAPISPGTKSKDPLYLEEILNLFDEHPQTMFVWCHAGISRRLYIDNLTQLLAKILRQKSRYQHVFIDLSWVIYENYIYDPKQRIDNREEWAKLIQMYPNNFMIGSDAVANFSNYTKEMQKFDPLLETIQSLKNGQVLAKKLAHDNFYNLMMSLRQKRGGSGVVLDPSYRYPKTNYLHTNRSYSSIKPAR